MIYRREHYVTHPLSKLMNEFVQLLIDELKTALSIVNLPHRLSPPPVDTVISIF